MKLGMRGEKGKGCAFFSFLPISFQGVCRMLPFPVPNNRQNPSEYHVARPAGFSEGRKHVIVLHLKNLAQCRHVARISHIFVQLMFFSDVEVLCEAIMGRGPSCQLPEKCGQVADCMGIWGTNKKIIGRGGLFLSSAFYTVK